MGKIFGLIGVIVVLGVGFYLYNQNMGGDRDSTMEGMDSANDLKENVENKGLVSSIKDAMGSGVAMSCTYAMSEGENTFESTVVVQGEKFRADSVVAGVTTHALSDGTDQYVWTEGSKTGFKMSKSCLEEMSKMAPATDAKNPTLKNAKETFDAAKNVKCSPATNTDFSVPQDVTFTDQCAAMKDSMKMMEQYKNQMPSSSY